MPLLRFFSCLASILSVGFDQPSAILTNKVKRKTYCAWLEVGRAMTPSGKDDHQLEYYTCDLKSGTYRCTR